MTAASAPDLAPASASPETPAPGGGWASPSANLDALRSLAVLFVVTSHLTFWEHAQAWIPPLRHFHAQALGLLGVGIFFVHTCLVLMMSLERQSRGGGRPPAVPFFVRRFFRIYPLSLVVVTTLLVAEAALGKPRAWPVAASNLLLVQNLTGHPSISGPLWSLPFEVQMYLALPTLFGLVFWARGRAPRVLLVLWGASVLLVLAFWRLGLDYHLIKYLPCFLPGVLAYSPGGTPRTASPLVLFGAVFATAAVFPVLVALGVKEHVAIWPVCFGLGWLLPRCRELKARGIKRAGEVVAKYSYEIYLVHQPCIDLAFGHLPAPAWMQWAAFVGATALLSKAAYELVERPGIAWGVRIAERWAAARA